MNKETQVEAKPALVSIIEDSAIHREWLKAQIEECNLLEIISVDQTGKSGIESIKRINPQIVLLDFQLADMTGLEVAKRIKAYNEDVKIFMLTAHAEAFIISRIIGDKNIDALAIKGSHYFELNFMAAIKYVLSGGTYLEPSVLDKIRQAKHQIGLSELTKREFELFIQINIGKSDQKIADDLCVELAHVRNMKSRILKKVKDDDLDGLLAKLIDNASVDAVEE